MTIIPFSRVDVRAGRWLARSRRRMPLPSRCRPRLLLYPLAGLDARGTVGEHVRRAPGADGGSPGMRLRESKTSLHPGPSLPGQVQRRAGARPHATAIRRSDTRSRPGRGGRLTSSFHDRASASHQPRSTPRPHERMEAGDHDGGVVAVDRDPSRARARSAVPRATIFAAPLLDRRSVARYTRAESATRTKPSRRAESPYPRRSVSGPAVRASLRASPGEDVARFHKMRSCPRSAEESILRRGPYTVTTPIHAVSGSSPTGWSCVERFRAVCTTGARTTISMCWRPISRRALRSDMEWRMPFMGENSGTA